MKQEVKVCGSIEPQDDPDLEPYECTLEEGHADFHWAVIDGELVASWRQDA